MSSKTLTEDLLFLSEDQQILLVNISQLKTHKYTVDEVINNIKKSSLNQFKINLEDLTNAVELCAIKDVTSMKIGERKDAELTLTLDPSKLFVKAKITSAFGGKPITSEQIYDDLKKIKVSFGVINQAIDLIIKKSSQGRPGKCYTINVAKGLAAIDGKDTEFIKLVESPRTKLVEAIIEPENGFELSNLEGIISVEQGAELMRIVPFKPGKAGCTVTGETLSYYEGKDIPIKLGKNTKISPIDPNLVISTVTGTPTETESGFMVDPILQLESVGTNSAPICHKGNLIIKGDVNPGAKVEATGNVTIFGFIESSFVKCGGDLFVLNGIIGDKIDEKNTEFTCAVKCGGSLFTSFIQYSKVLIAEDLNVQRQLLHSHILCAGYTTVQDKSGKRGVIFGGVLDSKKGVRTVNLGASSGVSTAVHLTAQYIPLFKLKSSLFVYLDKIKKANIKTRAALNKVNQIEPPEEINKLKELMDCQTRLKNTLTAYENKQMEITQKIQQNKDEIQNYMNTIRIHVSNTIFNNVIIKVGEQVFNSKSQRIKSATVCIKNGDLVAEKLENQDIEDASQE